MAYSDKYCVNFKELNAEYVLHDVMDNICKYLNMTDLGNIAQVCKSWNGAVKRETTRRSYIQQSLISYNYEDIKNKRAIYHMSDVLNVKPHVALLFIGSKLRAQSPANLAYGNSLEKEVVNLFKNQFPNKLISLEVCEFLTDGSTLFSSPDVKDQFTLESAGGGNIIGLFLPNIRQSQIHVAWCTGRNGINFQLGIDMADKLGFNDSDRSKSTTLMFARSIIGYFIAESLMQAIRVNFDESKDTVWGGVFDDELVGINCKSEKLRSSNQKCFIGLRISGASVESWAAIIDCSAKKCEVDQKLRELKERINRKRTNIGLVYGPRRTQSHSLRKKIYHDSHELMKAIKRVFPNIPFVGLFNPNCEILFGNDLLTDGSRRKLDQHSFMNVIVITFE